MKQYLLPEDLAHKVLNYLASKPFIEVQALIGELQKMQEVKDERNQVV